MLSVSKKFIRFTVIGIIFATLFAINLSAIYAAEPPSVEWIKSVKTDYIMSYSKPTKDGGYIFFGDYSKVLIKAGSNGRELWRKEYFKENYSFHFSSIHETVDNGYILLGQGAITDTVNTNVYLVKINKAGEELWGKEVKADGYGDYIEQTSDGGYIIAGYYPEVFLLKVDGNGEKQWEKRFGIDKKGSGSFVVKQTNDNGFIVIGAIQTGYDPEFGAISNIYVVKTDAKGNKEWEKTYGEKSSSIVSVYESTDKGFIIAGGRKSTISNSEIYLVKTDINGNIQWEKTYGRGIGEVVEEIPAGGYIVSSGSYLLKTDSKGNKEWEKSLEAIVPNSEWFMTDSIELTPDDGFIITGISMHPPGIDYKGVIVKISGTVKVILNGQLLKFDVLPILMNGYTMVPLRVIGESLGAKVLWDQKIKTVTLTTPEKTIKLKVTDKKAFVNGKLVNLDVPPTIVNGGFDIDIMNAIAKIESINIEFINTSWDGLFASLKVENDLLISAIPITDERKSVMDFSEPYFESTVYVTVPANSSVSKITELKGKKIAVQQGSLGEQFIVDIVGEENIVRYPGIIEAFIELANGKMDAVAADSGITSEFLRSREDFKGKIIKDANSPKEEYGIAVLKGNDFLLNKINSGLKKIKENGEYNRIYSKWFNE